MNRILLVEDSRTQAARAQLLLEDSGFEVEWVASGEAAVERFSADAFDLVLSDVLMPGLSGFDVCRRVKARSPATPVVLLTMLEDPQDILLALQSGSDSFVGKGSMEEALVKRLRDLLSARAARRGRSGGPIPVWVFGREYDVAPRPEQILDLLVGTFEDNVRTNRALARSNQQLEVQNDALRRVETLKSELSALVVHDLKSPTSGLLMLASMQLRNDALSQEERRRWRAVHASAELLQRMVLNLLDISRSEDGGLTPQPCLLKVPEVVHEVTDVLRFQIEDRAQVLTVAIDDRSASMRADRELVRRVLLNLLDNASRHAPARGRIAIGVQPGAPGWVRLTVTNSGSRIAEEHRERVFEKYVRLQPELEGSSGRGLGLPFCRTAVEAHGGRIWIEDGPENGTSFCLELPAGGDGP